MKHCLEYGRLCVGKAWQSRTQSSARGTRGSEASNLAACCAPTCAARRLGPGKRNTSSSSRRRVHVRSKRHEGRPVIKRERGASPEAGRLR